MIGSAFTTAWKSFKHLIAKTDSFLAANGPKIQAGVAEASQIAVALDPALAPIVTVFDGFEEALMGEVTAAVHTGTALTDASTGATTIVLSGELSGIIKQIANTISGHPAVVAAAAAK